MTPDNAVLQFMFDGFAVIGIFVLIAAPALYLWHKLQSIPTPLPDPKVDAELNRWQKPAPSPYDLSKVGGTKRRV
jgi:hypothetical protein